MKALQEQLCKEVNSTPSDNVACTEEFITPIVYIYRKNWLDIHMKCGKFYL